MALPPTTANWHWKNKTVTRWGREWFERELTTITVTGDTEGEVVSVASVTDFDGDVELGQRKSKLITIYDCKISLKWSGTASDGTEVKGSLTIPEVSHEITVDRLSDYAYAWSLTTASSPAVNALFALAKSRLPAALEAKFAEFPVALVDTHGKDLTVSTDPSRSATPAPGNGGASAAPSTSAANIAAAAASVVSQPARGEEKKKVNSTTVTVDATFQASADDLFGLLTDEKRIPMWTRAPAQSTAEVGSEYSLFGGGVKGKYVSLTRPAEIVQTWNLQSPTWPAGHIGTLTTTLAQSTDSTKVTFSLAGVPVGIQEEIRRNIEGYYIHGFKSIGYVQLIQSDPIYSAPTTKKRSNRTPKARGGDDDSASSSPSYTPAIVIAALVLVAAFSIPYLSSSPAPLPK